MNILGKTYVFINYLRGRYFWLRYKTYRSKYNIHPSFKFNGIDIEFLGSGEIIIGENSYIGNRSAIAAISGHKVVIGKNCSISHNVRIYTGNNNPNDIINEEKMISLITGNVIMGDNCWIGANVFIKEGITIGSHVVVGANSVVTKNIPDNCIAGGCPAKIIRRKA